MLGYAILFVFGLAVGSFLNVLALRYDGEHFLFDPRVIGGRSHCPHCSRTLRWFELVPVISFLIQGGKCRNCKAKISWQYPLVELISGILFVAVPWRLGGNIILSIFWIAAFVILLLITYIDIRLQIIPDELSVLLMLLALFSGIFWVGNFGSVNYSFLNPYAAFFGLQGDFWANRAVGALFGGAFFGALVLVTRGKGMGMGDVKLAVPLGFLFGWPDVLFLTASAFVFGACVGAGFLIRKTKTMKSALPFGPFLALAAAFIFFAGAPALGAYFHIIGVS